MKKSFLRSIALASCLLAAIATAHAQSFPGQASQNFVYAGPTAGSGMPAFRLLTPADVPAGSGTSAFSVTNPAYAGGATCSGGGGADNQAAFQAALNAVPDGGSLYIPGCTTAGQAYRLIGSGTCLLTRTTPINIYGDGALDSQLFIDPSVPNTRDVWCMNPSSTENFWSFRNIGILSGGVAARHAIHFDVPLGNYAFNVTVEGMYIDKTSGGNSFKLSNNVATTSGGVAYSTISKNLMESIKLDLAGDGVVIRNNVLSASGTNAAVNASFVAGAGGFVLAENVITSLNGHTIIQGGPSGGGASGNILNNEYETPVGVANVYCFMLDIGTVNPTQSWTIAGNSYAVLAGTKDPIPIRVRNNSTNLRISDNRSSVQTPVGGDCAGAGSHIQLDAGGTDTAIDRNTQYLVNNVIGAPVVIDNTASTTTGYKQYFADGTVSLPSWAFLGDRTTGIYRIAASTLGVAVGGIEGLRVAKIGGLGAIGVGTGNGLIGASIFITGEGGGGTFSVARSQVPLAGSGFTMAAGGAKVLTADANGGDMFIFSGIPTGVGSSAIWFFTYPPSGAGTADGTAVQAGKFWPTGGLSIGTNTDPGVGTIYINNAANMIRTKTAFTNHAAAAAGTLNNAPAAGNPTKWIQIDDNGTLRFIPAW